MAENNWIAEAIVDFLRGPLYINPLMAFIDEKCLIFTPEDENKLEYTGIHNEFKDLVDQLLTEFVEDLGVTSEIFYEVMAAEKDKDKLSGFVVQTILTVDDFLLFKAMMVKRNVDLTNQVLAGVEAMMQTAGGNNVDMPTKQGGYTHEEEAKMIEEALQLSEILHQNEDQAQRLRQLMWALQMEEEDIAMAIALANSLKDHARMEGELAELNQAIAMSAALAAEEDRLAKIGGGSGTGTKTGGGAGTGAKTGGSDLTGTANSNVLVSTGAASSFGSGGKASGGGTTHISASPAAPNPLDTLAPLKLGPNTAAEQMAAVAAAAEASARAVAAAVISGSATNSGSPMKGDAAVLASAKKGMEQMAIGGSEAAGGGRFVPSQLNLPAGIPGQGPPRQPGSSRFIPEPLNLDGPRKPSDDVPMENLILASLDRKMNKQGSVRNAAGYKSDGPGSDMSNLRDAATAAAASQKNLISGNKGGSESAQQWLQEQKIKLVAQKKVEREAETAAYKAGQSPMKAGKGSGGPPDSDDLEAKRAALRNKLAQKFKEDLIKQAM